MISVKQASLWDVRIGINMIFEPLLKLVRSFVLLIWAARKDNLYGDHSDAISDCSSSCPLTGGPTSSACVRVCVVNGVSAMAAS